MPCSDIAGCHEVQGKAPVADRIEYVKQLRTEKRYEYGGAISVVGVVLAVLAWLVDPSTVVPTVLVPLMVHVKQFIPLIIIGLTAYANQKPAALPTQVPAQVTGPEEEGP